MFLLPENMYQNNRQYVPLFRICQDFRILRCNNAVVRGTTNYLFVQVISKLMAVETAGLATASYCQ
ncbi:hypothetical protein GGE60_003142 [Rhizobium leucaenae]|uniref:Uncharacterized protein n=1 Tax=Rhizobium leucaenae TaxID=29450 RepID=A0A7W6ZVQ6_9HYPH|nr:hypothetical protein [Rhizobium leucaenae]